MSIKVGLRTVKTAVCAGLGIVIAQQIGLLNPTSAGIIALLSVTNSKKSSFATGFLRVCSLALATGIAFVCFTVIGYNAIAFSLYLLVFIPLAVKGKMSEGIAVSSVLVTHYLIAESMTLKMLTNSFLLLFIGVGLALIANLYMPDVEGQLKRDQVKVDQKIKRLLDGMAHYLQRESGSPSCDRLLAEVVATLTNAEVTARHHDDNRLLSTEIYYLDYFTMRRLQVNVLTKMNELVKEIELAQSDVNQVSALLDYTATTFSEDNDGIKISRKIEETLAYYRQAPLPTSRLEFENRARLYHLLSEFERFIELKISFSQAQKN